jgi:hypothetical protein
MKSIRTQISQIYANKSYLICVDLRNLRSKKVSIICVLLVSPQKSVVSKQVNE